MKVRTVYENVEVDVECCDHCHGDPQDCGERVRSVSYQATLARMGDAPVEDIVDLLYRSHRALVGEVRQFEREAIMADLRQFLVTWCNPKVAPL